MTARLVALWWLLPLLACSGGGGSGGEGGNRGGSGVPGVESTRTCSGACPQEALSVAQVQRVINQAVAQVGAIPAAPATIAVVDRVGNVLAVFQMAGAAPTVRITSQRGVTTGLEDIVVPSTLAAISKAATGAYLSSQGNAFTTRTANQIVQQNFNPGVNDVPGGPLFGVQFSQLPCGDLVKTFGGVDALEGPKRLPLGFAADPGGLPLYINGVPVGGVGVEIDGFYSVDSNVQDTDGSPEERVATAATGSFQAPEDRRADRISVGGLTLRFADDETTASAPVPGFDASRLVAVPGFANAVVTAGVTFLTPASGVVATTFEGQTAEILVDTAGLSRFPPTDSTTPGIGGGGGLTSNEVRVLLREALGIAGRARAGIRRPLDSAVRVSVSVVDLAGNVLGLVRSPDAPIFGIDVSLQKARSVALFSQTTAAASFAAAVDTGTLLGSPGLFGTQPFSQYVADLSTFTRRAMTLTNGIAFGDRTIGNLARPFFPDGINANANGPLSKPFSQWSPFSTGLQLEVSLTQLALVLCPFPGTINSLFAGVCPSPTGDTCTDASLATIRNGLQIFAGSVPIYRGATLVGAIGISGDGIDQDDMVAFLGLHQAGVALGGAIGNAPPAIRGDTVNPMGGFLRYVSCPVTPFLDSNEQTPCAGK